MAPLTVSMTTDMFQFQSGAIKSMMSTVSGMHPANSFNSSLVRLKDLSRADLACADLTFQFQSGAIKRAGPACRAGELYASFNSSLVRLKGIPAGIQLMITGRRFNSSLVRLKVEEATGEECDIRVSFNSSLVRLKATTCVYRLQTQVSVSIPVWCD